MKTRRKAQEEEVKHVEEEKEEQISVDDDELEELEEDEEEFQDVAEDEDFEMEEEETEKDKKKDPKKSSSESSTKKSKPPTTPKKKPPKQEKDKDFIPEDKDPRFWFKNHKNAQKLAATRKKKTLKQLISAENSSNPNSTKPNVPTFQNIEVNFSSQPFKKKYCWLTGLEGKYTDPTTKIVYHSADVFTMVAAKFHDKKQNDTYVNLCFNTFSENGTQDT